MAIQYVGGQTQALTAANQSITFSLSGGIASVPANGDIVIITISVANVSDITLSVITTGYTKLSELYSDGTSNDTNTSISYKMMGASPDSSVLVSGKANSLNSGVAVISVYRGVSTSTPIDVTLTTAALTGSVVPNPSPITPATPGAVIVVSGAGAHGRGSAGTFTASYLSGFSTLVDASGTTYDVTSGMGYVAWTSGQYDPAAWTFGSANGNGYSSGSFTVALRPSTTSVSVNVTGVQSSSAVGSASVSGMASAGVSGVSATSSVGSALVAESVSASASGVEAISSVGQTSPYGSASSSVTGQTASGSVGQATVFANSVAQVAGQSASSAVGSTSVSAKASASVSGVASSGLVGGIAIRQSSSVTLSGVASSCYVGSSTAAASARVASSGVSASGGVGSAQVSFVTMVYVFGVSGVSSVGSVLVWSIVIPDQAPDYGDIIPSQSPSYAGIFASQSAGYSSVAPDQDAGYSDVATGQSPNWTTSAA